jgi:hypothetical protein
MLERLADADCDFNRLAEIMPGGTQSAKKRKAYHSIDNRIEDGLMAGGRGRYFITQEGRDLLQALDSGSSADVRRAGPNCRVFA